MGECGIKSRERFAGSELQRGPPTAISIAQLLSPHFSDPPRWLLSRCGNLSMPLSMPRYLALSRSSEICILWRLIDWDAARLSLRSRWLSSTFAFTYLEIPSGVKSAYLHHLDALTSKTREKRAEMCGRVLAFSPTLFQSPPDMVTTTGTFLAFSMVAR